MTCKNIIPYIQNKSIFSTIRSNFYLDNNGTEKKNITYEKLKLNFPLHFCLFAKQQIAKKKNKISYIFSVKSTYRQYEKPQGKLIFHSIYYAHE